MFTPGPWHVEGFNPPRIYANDGLDIIAQCDSCGEKARKEEMANARLIAAAPEMYSLLKAYVATMPDQTAVALLNKIEGK